MKRNLYRILGVKKDADLATIKKAYRRAAKRFHPDISAGTERQFRDVQEAYEILSDPQKRSVYDRENVSKPPIRMASTKTAFVTPHSLDFFEQFFFGLKEPWFGSFPDIFAESKRRPGSLAVEVILTPEEAEQGGEILLPVQFEIFCEPCHGSGRFARFICDHCLGSGKVGRETKIRLRIPAGVRNGLVQRIPLWNSGYQEIDLTLTFLVRPN
ncbi:MAG: DnaJ domain-containing protein [Syntrophaceae bacterium]|nr:DnaJ domain-containing protein [Syntrophaceae bacterium]